MNNKENKLKKVINLLDKKKELLTELLNLSQYHEEFCVEEKTDKLKRLIKSQNLRVDKSKKIDKQVKMISKELAILEFSKSPELDINVDIDSQLLSQLEAKKKEINHLLVKLKRRNENNQEIVWNEYRFLKKKVLKINHAKKVRTKYEKKPLKSSGFFVNRKEKSGYRLG